MADKRRPFLPAQRYTLDATEAVQPPDDRTYSAEVTALRAISRIIALLAWGFFSRSPYTRPSIIPFLGGIVKQKFQKNGSIPGFLEMTGFSYGSMWQYGAQRRRNHVRRYLRTIREMRNGGICPAANHGSLGREKILCCLRQKGVEFWCGFCYNEHRRSRVSSSVEWSLPKPQRRVRFPYPAPQSGCAGSPASFFSGDRKGGPNLWNSCGSWRAVAMPIAVCPLTGIKSHGII